jgi:predicted TIM-barrel fold metal-dependent hydrolase
MKRIDVQHHIFPLEYVSKLKEMGITESYGQPIPNWTPDKSLAFKPTLKALQEFVGSKQIVYGTDFPFGAKFASLALKDLKKYDGFSKEDFEAIDYKNCSGLFPQTLAQTQ